jgi:hypothetical protein
VASSKKERQKTFRNLLSSLGEVRAVYHRIISIALRILNFKGSKTIRAPRQELPRKCETTKKSRSYPKDRSRKEKFDAFLKSASRVRYLQLNVWQYPNGKGLHKSDKVPPKQHQEGEE